jgi:ribosomal protein S18 acetylase RimI-like enzyme
MNDAERVHEAMRTMFENLCGVFDDARFERREGYDFLLFPAVPIPQFNGIWPLDDTAVPTLATALEEIEQLGLPASVQVRRGRTPRVEEEAKRLGLTAEEPIPGMVVRADELAAPEVDDLEVVRVETADGLAQALAVAATGFGAPPDLFAPIYMLEVAALDGIAYYLGRVDGRDVSTSTGYTLGDTVGIFNVATPPEHRGRGYGAALTAQAALAGFANGVELAWLGSSAMGLSVYRRLGFREVETYVLLSRTAQEA